MPSSMEGIRLPDGVRLEKPVALGPGRLFAKDALDFVVDLQATFGKTRLSLLRRRKMKQELFDRGGKPGFLDETRGIREARWKAAAAPADLQKRWGEFWGPPDRRILIEGMNSGADVYTVDMENFMSPTWEKVLEAQVNLWDAPRGTLTFEPLGEEPLRLRSEPATLIVRPRGLEHEETRVTWNETPLAASFFDFGLFFYNNAHYLLNKGSGPYFCLPKVETHLEARFWNEVFDRAQKNIGLSPGTIRAVVPIETLSAAFEMEEILYELRGHSAGLVSDREAYLSSVLRQSGGFFDGIFPDHKAMAMSSPFLHAYEELLVKTCHKRGAHALGGMTRFVPSEDDPGINEIALVETREDKIREAAAGFDGARAAQPEMVSVVRRVFEERLEGAPHQVNVTKNKVGVTAKELLRYQAPGAKLTEAGVRSNVKVCLRYLEDWLRGEGSSVIENRIQNVASADLAWAQLRHWSRSSGAKTVEGERVDMEMMRRMVEQEIEQMRRGFDDARLLTARIDEASQLFWGLVESSTPEGTLVTKGRPYLERTGETA